MRSGEATSSSLRQKQAKGRGKPRPSLCQLWYNVRMRSLKSINTSVYDFPSLIRKGCVYIDKSAMIESVHTFATSGGQAVSAAVCLGSVLKSAVRRLVTPCLLLSLIFCGFRSTAAGLAPEDDWIGTIHVPTNEVGIPEGRVVVESGSAVTVTVTGLPKKGLAFDKATQAFSYDAETLPDGNYALVVSAQNVHKYKNDKVVTFTSEGHETEKDPLDWGESYYVGQTCSIACDEFVALSKTDSLTLKGLPAGLKLVKYADGDGLPCYRIEGTPTKSGRSVVTWTEKHAKGAAKGDLSVNYYMIVDGAPSKYVDICDDDLPSGCKVTGAGVYDAGKKITLKATAAKGLVFAGWYQDASFRMSAEADVDYRTPTLTLTDVTKARDVYYPRFIELKKDFCDEIVVPELNEAGVPEGVIAVVSESLPTVTVSGLPAGLTFDKKANALVFNAAKMKAGDYAFVISAKNAGGYKNDRVVTFVYGDPGDVPASWGTDYAVGQIVYEQVDFNLTGLPKGLKCVKGTDEFGETVYFISGVPTKAGRFTVKADGEPCYMIVQGAPSRYVEVILDGDAPIGCKATGSGVYAAGATVKTSVTAKNCVFAGWYAEEEGDGPSAKGEGKLDPFDNVYAEFQGKDGDWRLAAQTWLCGVKYDEESSEFVDTVPDVLIARFTGKAEDVMAADAIVVRDDEGTEVGSVWDVFIDETRNAAFADEEGVTSQAIFISVDSVSAPKLTIKGTIAGITVRNFGTHAELYYDPTGKTMPKPGEYTLTLTAVNQSKSTVSRTLTVRVPNVVDEEGIIWPSYGPEGAFTKGDYSAFTLGETVDLSAVDVFGEEPEGIVRTITLAGLPAGVKATGTDGAVSGVPTKAGCYTVTVTVKYKYDGETSWSTTAATVFFRVEAIDTTCVGTFNGAAYDAGGAGAGTISATVSAAGKVTSCKLIDLKGKSTSLTFKEQTFEATEGYYLIAATDKGGDEYRFELYPAWSGDAGILALGGTLLAERQSGEASWTATAQQNVWGDKTYKAAGLLPGYSSVGVDYEEDDLEMVFKSAGAVTVTRGKKSGSARFELATVQDVDDGAGDVVRVWSGSMTVNVPDGTDEGYCKTFAVTVKGAGAKPEIEVEKENRRCSSAR